MMPGGPTEALRWMKGKPYLEGTACVASTGSLEVESALLLLFIFMYTYIIFLQSLKKQNWNNEVDNFQMY